MPRRPNILWICTDQQRFDTIAALGHPHLRTPNLDRLVNAGVSFTDVYCQNPICSPSRSSFLTGLYPSGLRANINGNAYFADVAPLAPKTLADSGYQCGLVGKLHLASAESGVERRVDDGYSYFHYSHGPTCSAAQGNQHILWLQGQGRKLADVFLLNAAGEIEKHRPDIDPDLHQTSWCGLQAEQYIKRMAHEEDPWMLSLNFFAPHPPWDPPNEYRRRYAPDSLPPPHARSGEKEIQDRLSQVADFPGRAEDLDAAGRQRRADYHAMIELVDHRVGRVLEALEATGQRDRTLVIFMSDHGEMLGDHALFTKGCRLYEGAVRVPLIIGGLPGIRAGLRSSGLVELTDLVPTLHEFAGLPPPLRSQGLSLAPILRGESDPAHHRENVWSEYFDTVDIGSTVTRKPFPYHHTRATMLRDARYKLISYHGTGVGELFDLQNDPWEFENLWDRPEHRDVRHRLTAMSGDRLAASVDLGPRRVGRY